VRSVILAAGLLVLVGLGLFVAGILTGSTVLYWACVAACAVAAVLLVVTRRKLPPETATTAPETPPARAAGTRARRRAEPKDAPEEAEAEPVDDEAQPGLHATAHRTATGSAVHGPSTSGRGQHAAPSTPAEMPEPPVEEVEVTDLLLVVDLTDDVLVVDEHPRYHLEGCRFLAGRETIPLPVDEARTDGFTPCGLCAPDRQLADRERARRARH
jgi:hypothetical protein